MKPMRLLLSIGAIVLFTLPAIASAATLASYPSSVALKATDSVEFTIILQSTADINTVGTAVMLPPNLVFLSAEQGPVLTEWIQQPTFDKTTNAVSFSGIIPGGWSGEGTLATIKVAALKDGTYSLAFDPTQTEIYKNDGNATPEPVAFGSLNTPFGGPPFFLGLAVVLALILLLIKLFSLKYKLRFV